MKEHSNDRFTPCSLKWSPISAGLIARHVFRAPQAQESLSSHLWKIVQRESRPFVISVTKCPHPHLSQWEYAKRQQPRHFPMEQACSWFTKYPHVARLYSHAEMDSGDLLNALPESRLAQGSSIAVQAWEMVGRPPPRPECMCQGPW